MLTVTPHRTAMATSAETDCIALARYWYGQTDHQARCYIAQIEARVRSIANTLIFYAEADAAGRSRHA